MNHKGSSSFNFPKSQLNILQRDRSKMGKSCVDRVECKRQLYWAKFKVIHFFRVLPENCHSLLKLPEIFVKNCLLEELSGTSTVSLKGPSGVTWDVQLRRYSRNGDEELYLKNGWEVFAKEHNLKENDMLVFKFQLRGFVFDVLVLNDENFFENESSYFVRNTCQRSNVGLNLNERKRVEREPSLEIFEPKMKRIKVIPINISDDEEEGSHSGTLPAPGLKGKPLASVKLEQRECINSQAPGRKGIALASVKLEQHECINSRAPGPKGKAAKSEQDSKEEDNQVKNPLAAVERRGSGFGKDKGVLFQRAVTEGKRRGTPHFVVLIKTTHVAHPFFMTVPVESARKYIPARTRKVSLKMNDRMWSIKFKGKAFGFGFRGWGWRDFASKNNLKVGDVVLFELTSAASSSSKISKNPDPVIFTATIFTKH